MSSEKPLGEQVAIRENKLDLVERLADDLAHEIKNPLHSMLINLEVLRRRISLLDAVVKEELLRYAGVLGVELERVNRRVDLLLRLVRPPRESDEPATLGEVLEELRELVEIECSRHGVDLEMDPADLPLQARPPRAATRQTILSLILKTLDALPAGSTLRVGFTAEPDWIRLRFEGVRTPGSEPPALPEHADDSFLQVVGALAERLRGRIDALTDAAPPNPSGATGFVLSVPAG